MSKHMARAAGGAYILWGLIHVIGGAAMLSAGGALGIASMLSGVVHTGTIPEIIDGVTLYHSFNIVLFGIGVLAAGILIIRRNTMQGHIAAFLLAGLADLGLVLFLIVPGYMTITDAIPGLFLFAVGAVLSFISNKN